MKQVLNSKESKNDTSNSCEKLDKIIEMSEEGLANISRNTSEKVVQDPNLKSKSNKSEIVYHDLDDELHDYGIHRSGRLVNPYGHWVRDGYNESVNEYEDVVRRRIGLNELGNEENWKKEIDKKIAGTKRKVRVSKVPYQNVAT